MSVLIVEDDPAIAEIHRRFVQRLAGFEAAETWTAAGGVTDSGADTRTTPIAYVEEAQGRRFVFPASLIPVPAAPP